MRSLQTIIGIALLTFFIATFSSYGADVAKIGVIDFQRILETSSAGKASQAEINKQGKAMEAELKKNQEDLEEIKKRLEREALVMTKDMREEKEREFRIKVNDFRALEQKFKKDISDLNKRLVKRMQDDVFDLVEEIGKKEGYLLVVEKTEGGVVYAPNTIDITDKLIQLYNTRFAQKTEKKEKSDKK
ncbi:MAG: OmpH family outer membrane protein [Thermodesulfobacteriota bacterium]